MHEKFLKCFTGYSTPPAYMLIRGKKYKYIEYETGEREYYDLENDPDEMNNIFQNLSRKEKALLSSRLHEISRGGSHAQN